MIYIKVETQYAGNRRMIKDQIKYNKQSTFYLAALP